MTRKISKRFKIIKVALIKEAAILHFIIWQTQSVCSHWFFLGQDFAAIHVFLFWSKAGKFNICNQDSEKKRCENCHYSH